MTDRTPLDDVEFLARSRHRVSVLETLRSGSTTRAELRDDTEISQPTLGRVLTGLQERNWITLDGQHYSLTPLGRMLADKFADLLKTVDTVQELSDVVEVLPTKQIGFNLQLLSDATITMAAPSDVLVHIRRAERVLSDANHLRVLTPSIFPGALEKLLEGQSPQHHEAVLTGGAIKAMMENPTILEATQALMAADSLDVFRYDGPVSIMLAMVDGQALIAPLDENDLPRALIESENQTICSWVDAKLDEYRDASTLVTVDDLTL